ncbi:hypothetical protein ACJ8ME_03600 [Bifidobacterium bifidum]|uniref:hypothetical protein n=1 Tax=Bifidobacterium bifidum TaxID=1681 RepID=UPI003B995652
MSANPLWLTLLSPALSFLALAVNVWITFRNWQRRPAAHWTCIPIHGKEGRADFNRFLKDANDDLEKSDGIGHMFALTNNGEMQAAGVKLFALGCSVQAIQYLDTPHGQAKDIGAEFAFVEPRGTAWNRLRIARRSGIQAFPGWCHSGEKRLVPRLLDGFPDPQAPISQAGFSMGRRRWATSRGSARSTRQTHQSVQKGV